MAKAKEAEIARKLEETLLTKFEAEKEAHKQVEEEKLEEARRLAKEMFEQEMRAREEAAVMASLKGDTRQRTVVAEASTTSILEEEGKTTKEGCASFSGGVQGRNITCLYHLGA